MLCAVKQLETSTMDEKERNAAVKEAWLLKRMDHPNIVRFQEAFMTRRGRICIVMDYADGGDIRAEILAQHGRLMAEARVLEWFVQICSALQHVHGRQVLHRDLKTQNIFLMASGQIKLGDFGISRVLDATKGLAKTLIGTPYYYSPEIIEDEPYGFKSDIWSFGVVLYEMTTLLRPFDSKNIVILAVRIVNGAYPEPDPMYSLELKALIRDMLRRDPLKRPTADAILALPILYGPAFETDMKYSLGLDLSPCVTTILDPFVVEAPTTAAEVALEDDSGSEIEREEHNAPNDLQRSVAGLRLSGALHNPVQAARVPLQHGGAVTLGETMDLASTTSRARISSKADALRSYVCSQMPQTDFEAAYALVREASTNSVLAEELQGHVGSIIGADMALELFALFQLLCFLEDVAEGS